MLLKVNAPDPEERRRRLLPEVAIRVECLLFGQEDPRMSTLPYSNLLGHSSPMMVRRYSATYDSEQAAAGARCLQPCDAAVGSELGVSLHNNSIPAGQRPEESG